MTVGNPGPRIPVLVGIGVADADAEAVELMACAVEAALTDCGSTGVARAIDRIAVPQGTWTYPDPARLVADRVGAPGRAPTSWSSASRSRASSTMR